MDIDEAAEAIQDALQTFYDTVDEALGDMIDALDGDEGEYAADLRKMVEAFRDDPMGQHAGGITLDDFSGWLANFEPAEVVSLMKRNGWK